MDELWRDWWDSSSEMDRRLILTLERLATGFADRPWCDLPLDIKRELLKQEPPIYYAPPAGLVALHIPKDDPPSPEPHYTRWEDLDEQALTHRLGMPHYAPRPARHRPPRVDDIDQDEEEPVDRGGYSPAARALRWVLAAILLILLLLLIASQVIH